jgi:hypothetical protein
VNCAQIKRIHHIDQKASKMVFREPVMQRRRQQQRLIQIVGTETLAHEQYFRKG